MIVVIVETAIHARRGGSTEAGEDAMIGRLIEALSETLTHARGETVTGMVLYRIAMMSTDEMHAIRAHKGAGRAKFAERFCLDLRTLRDWDQGWRACCC